MLKTLVKKITLISIILIIVLSVIFVGILFYDNEQKAEILSSVAMMANTEEEPFTQSCANEDISTFSFGIVDKHYNAGGKSVQVKIDPKDSIFGDHVIMEFKCTSSGLNIDFFVDFKLNHSIRKSMSWGAIDYKGKKTLNSGLFDVDEIVVKFVIDHKYEFIETFYKY